MGRCRCANPGFGSVMLGWVDSETGALILSADRDGFREFASLLRKPLQQTVRLKEAESWPMARAIGALTVERTGDTVVIKVDGDIARLAGSGAGFERLSDVRSVLAADSCPLIVAGPVPGKTGPEV
jgi:hypothetical protein